MRDEIAAVRTCRAVQLGAKALALGVATLVVGCVSSQSVRLDEWGGAQNCHFAHITKQDFETALHRVFEASGPRIYGLRPEGGGALVEQHWTLDVVFASGSGTERWRLEYAPAGDGIDARAEVEQVPGVGALRTGKDVKPPGDTGNYELLWSRLQYVLGGRADWPRCERSSKVPHAGLCSKGASPPLRLARSSEAAAPTGTHHGFDQ